MGKGSKTKWVKRFGAARKTLCDEAKERVRDTAIDYKGAQGFYRKAKALKKTACKREANFGKTKDQAKSIYNTRFGKGFHHRARY